MTSDKELEDRLRATFVARAETVDHGPAWDASVSAGSEHDLPGMTPPRGQRFLRRWRAPLLAAAAVVLIAVATSAIVTGGFGGGNQAATPASGHAGGTPPVTVPITCGFTMTGNASGTAGGTAAGGNATGRRVPGEAGVRAPSADAESGSGAAVGHGPGPSSESNPPTTTSSPKACTSPGRVEMSFNNGAPPKAGLSWTLRLGGNKVSSSAEDVHSEGAPPSYLSFGGAIYENHRYLWGVVGPMVSEVQIQALQRADSPDSDTGFSGASAYWTIGSGQGTEFSLPGQDDVIWTDLGGGWHGFAIQPPLDTRQIDMTTLAADGHAYQTRSFRLTEGEAGASELPPQTPVATTLPPAGTVTSGGGGSDTGASMTQRGGAPPTLRSTDQVDSASESGWPSISRGPGAGPIRSSSVKAPSSTLSTTLFSATTEPFPAGCPSTRQTGSAGVPDVLRKIGGTWFGHDDLWVNAPAVVGYGGTKFSSVTLNDHGDFTDGKGAPTLTAQLVGGSATSEMTGTSYSSETVHGRTVHFWPTTISLPRSGTWLMTETLGDTTLRFCMTAA